MRINKVTIQNFRGIHYQTPFPLGEKFILLSAQNGMGKTTVIDAIEWALTGTIGRLEHAYRTRSTNEAERKNTNNLSGILKNKNAAKLDSICVELEFQVDGQVFIIQRKQMSDLLDPQKSLLNILQGDVKQCHRLLKELSPNFYAHHFCDIQKSVNMQSTKRSNFVEMFNEFITDYGKEEVIANNLSLFANDVDRYISDIDFRCGKIIPQIETTRTILDRFQKEIAIFKYPDTKIYEGEKIDTQQMSEQELTIQLHELYDCGYTKVLEILEPLKQHELHAKIVNRLSLVEKLVETKKEQIDKAVHLSNTFGDLGQSISNCEEWITKYEKIVVSRATLGLYAPEIIEIRSPEFTQEFYDQKQKEVTAIEQQVTELTTDIAALTQGNQILNALTSLLENQAGLVAYKHQQHSEKGSAKCPVCGSELFGKMQDDQILSEVRSYTNRNKDIVAGKKKKIRELQQARDHILDNMIHVAKAVLDGKIRQLKAQFGERSELMKQTDLFFKCVQFLRPYEQEIPLSRWSEIDFIREKKEAHSRFLLPDTRILAEKSNYNNILLYLDFQTDDCESATALSSRIIVSRQTPIVLLPEFSVKYLSDKINSLKSRLNNKKILDQSKKLKTLSEEKKQLEIRRGELISIKTLAEKRATDITNTISELREKEYKSVGPYLCLLYKKLARVNSIKEVNISHNNGTLSIIDEKGKNIINILSNGQLSVFTLSYFFAGLLARRYTEQCKVYFIDDLTACMDDVNMLSFLDLMKYQMLEEQTESGSIDQLFFASCDYRVCELIRYKLTGSHIPFYEIKDDAFRS